MNTQTRTIQSTISVKYVVGMLEFITKRNKKKLNSMSAYTLKRLSSVCRAHMRCMWALSDIRKLGLCQIFLVSMAPWSLHRLIDTTAWLDYRSCLINISQLYMEKLRNCTYRRIFQTCKAVYMVYIKQFKMYLFICIPGS